MKHTHILLKTLTVTGFHGFIKQVLIDGGLCSGENVFPQVNFRAIYTILLLRYD